MIKALIQKQGKVTFVEIPVEALEVMGVSVGSWLTLYPEHGRLTAVSEDHPRRKRYKISELLAGMTQERFDELNSASRGAMDGDPVGKELL